jgi:aminopeptidase N
MLRGVLGTEDFWSGIRLYYSRFINKQATNDDLRKAMQDACILTNQCPADNRDLSWFFHEWLNRGGFMTVNGGWHYDPAAKQLEIALDQTQAGEPYKMPIEVGLMLPPGVTLPSPAADRAGAHGATAPALQIVKMTVDRQHNALRIPLSAAPTAVELDPNTWLPMMRATFVEH